MGFRKLVLCMLITVVAMGFSNIKAYAAEETAIGQEQEGNTEESVLETVNIQDTLANEAVVENPEVADGEEDKDQGIVEDKESAGDQENVEDKESAEDQENSEDKENADIEDTQETEEASKEAADNKEETKEKAARKYTEAELRLLSAIIYCEAQSESYNGKLAVGIVVMNRVRSSRYPDSVKGVIYQKHQFSPVASGSLETALRQYDKGNFTSMSEKECIKAAKAALSGTTELTIKGKKVNFSKYLSFSGSLRGYTYRIGNHRFK